MYVNKIEYTVVVENILFTSYQISASNQSPIWISFAENLANPS